ncbi:glycosyltransferase family 4 protein [Verrucosispora sp. WMMD1129]|uniref:glycosyltransferase family 4 protein n=1 Tax=Verrucosispora sp. WMMD1129 TaxID=3016093 RepID=UPI00249AFE08|nr:glycosyltransferase family 4 protein [Verrucosispora sp. WMMD1129]WFE43951.1 glycosyltransferase family 4 protein [Verrucosispora sp. WMMD1129]
MTRPDARFVMIINHYAKPVTAGGGTRHAELFSRLKGWRHVIVAADFDHASKQRFLVDDASFIQVRASAYQANDHRRVMNWLTYSLRAFLTALRGPRPDVVYASSPHILAPVAGWLSARIRRTAFVLEVRDLWPQSIVDTRHLRTGSLTHRLLTALERWLYRRADRIVIVTAAWRSYFQDLGIETEKLEWVSNSAEPADFDVRPDLAPLRERCETRGRLLVYAGAHGPANGLDMLLDAATAIPEHTFLLIGDGMEKVRLKDRVHRESIDNVRFLDPMSKQELAGVLGSADIGIHVLADAPVFQLGVSPNKLYDYMAAGLPVVTNCMGEPHDVVVESGAGVAVAPGELASGISKLVGLDDDSLWTLGQRGRRYIQENRSRTVMSARLQRVLDETVAVRQVASAPVPRLAETLRER